MRFLKIILGLIFFVLITTTFIFSDDSKVRVTASKANIRLKPDIQSEIVTSVPLGALLDVIRKERDWYHVKLPPDEKGIVVVGYIHQSIVEVIEEVEEMKKEEKKEIEEKKVIEEVKEKPLIKKPEIPAELERKPLSEKEKYLIETDPYYLTWKNKLEQAEKEKKSTNKWIWLGAGGMGVGYLVMPIAGALTASGGGGETGNTMVLIGMGIGTIGIATMIYGLVQHHSKSEKIGKILEEGMIKGYIGANINPLKKQYAITLAITF